MMTLWTGHRGTVHTTSLMEHPKTILSISYCLKYLSRDASHLWQPKPHTPCGTKQFVCRPGSHLHGQQSKKLMRQAYKYGDFPPKLTWPAFSQLRFFVSALVTAPIESEETWLRPHAAAQLPIFHPQHPIASKFSWLPSLLNKASLCLG